MINQKHILLLLTLLVPATAIASDPGGYIVFLYVPLLLISLVAIPLLWAATKGERFSIRRKIIIRILSISILWSPIPYGGFYSWDSSFWAPASLVIFIPPYTQLNEYLFSVVSIVVSSLILYFLVKIALHIKMKMTVLEKNNE